MNDPHNYVSFNSVQNKDTTELLEERRRHLQWKEGENVLDIGCGPGDVTTNILFPLLPQDATLVGCDISEEMIKYCNQFVKNDRISFKVADIVQEDIGNYLQLESFDKVFSFFCLHWINDHRRAIQNVYSLLKPSGETLLMFLTPEHCIYLSTEKLRVADKWKTFMKKKRQWFYESDDPPSYFHAILEEVGFRNIKCYLQKKNHFTSWEELIGLVKAVNPYLCDVPTEMKSEYIQDIKDLLKEECQVEHDIVNYNYNIMIAVAQKPMK